MATGVALSKRPRRLSVQRNMRRHALSTQSIRHSTCSAPAATLQKYFEDAALSVDLVKNPLLPSHVAGGFFTANAAVQNIATSCALAAPS